MRNALPGVGPLVDDETVALLRNAEPFGDIPRGEKNFPENLRVLGLGLVDPRHVRLRYDQRMHGGYGTDVAESHHVRGLQDDLRLRFQPDSPTRKAAE